MPILSLPRELPESQFYVDGVSAGNNAGYTGAIPAGSGAVYIGSFNDGAQRFFNGYIDEVALYGRALSLEEIQAQYYRRKSASVQPTWTLGEIELATVAQKNINHEWKTGFHKGF